MLVLLVGSRIQTGSARVDTFLKQARIVYLHALTYTKMYLQKQECADTREYAHEHAQARENEHTFRNQSYVLAHMYAT
jgi:hypothetical protein